MNRAEERPVELARRIDRVCDHFEAAWGRGERPQIESALEGWDGHARGRLLRELLELEWALLRSRAETPQAGVYRERFPEEAEYIHAKLDADETQLASGSTPSPSATGETAEVWRPNDQLRLRGDLEIVRLHATGGIGQVYVATDPILRREVAVKRIKPDYDDDPHSSRRFRLEAEITGRLEHPGIVPVHGQGNDPQGRPFYVMKFIRGESLQDRIEQFHHGAQQHPRETRQLEFRRLLNHFVAACRAIDYAHSHHVVHRDLKPSNIMLGTFGETQVVDWGLARLVDGEPDTACDNDATLNALPTGEILETAMGTKLGTPAYMSPEQAEGALDLIDNRTDVYGLGATLYALLTGAKPFDGKVRDVIANVRAGRFPRPRQRLRSVAPPLEAVCLKAMQRDPTQRYPTAAALADDIEAYLGDQPVSAWREPLHLSLQRTLRRHQNTLLAVLLALAVLVIGLIARQYVTERGARAVAVEEADSANRLAEVFEELYGGLIVDDKPTFLLGIDNEADDLLATAERVRLELDTERRVKARLLDTIGEHLTMMGDLANGEKYLLPALQLRREDNYSSAELAASLHHVAFLRWCQGRNEEAHRQVKQAVEIRAAAFGENHEKALASKILLLLASNELKLYFDPALMRRLAHRNIEVLNEIVAVKEQRNLASDPDIAALRLILVMNHVYLGQQLDATRNFFAAQEAYAALEQTQEFRESGSQVHPGQLLTPVVRGLFVDKFPQLTALLGRSDANFERALQLSRQAFHRNESHPGNLWVQIRLADDLKDQARAEEELLRILDLARTPWSGQPRLISLLQLITETILRRAGKMPPGPAQTAAIEQAATYINEALELAQRVYGDHHWVVGECLKRLARVDVARGDYMQAERTLRKCLATFDAADTQGYRWLDHQARDALVNVIQMQGNAAVERAAEINAILAEKEQYARQLQSRAAEIVDEVVPVSLRAR